MAGPVGNDLQHYHPFLVIAYDAEGPFYAEAFVAEEAANERAEDLRTAEDPVKAIVFAGTLDADSLPFYRFPGGVYDESVAPAASDDRT